MKNSENVSSIFSESPRKLFRLSAVVFLAVIIIAICYLILVKYDTYYECDFVMNSEKNRISSELINLGTGQIENVSLMIEEKKSPKNIDNILIVSTKLSEEYLDYFSNSYDKGVVIYFEEGRRNQYTDGIPGEVIEIKNGFIVLQINKMLADEPLFRGRIFLNYPIRGKIKIKRFSFIKSIFS